MITSILFQTEPVTGAAIFTTSSSPTQEAPIPNFFIMTQDKGSSTYVHSIVFETKLKFYNNPRI